MNKTTNLLMSLCRMVSRNPKKQYCMVFPSETESKRAMQNLKIAMQEYGIEGLIFRKGTLIKNRR